MRLAIEISVCIMAWTLTMFRLKTIHWSDIGKDHGIALRVWLMMVFFSITSIFIVEKFNNFFDAYTFKNLDRLIAYSAVLIGMTFGVTASIDAVNNPSYKFVSRWLWIILFAAIIAMTVIYSFFLSRLPNITYYIPRSLPEVGFMLTMYPFGALLCITLGKVYLAYLPLETSPVMRMRAILIIVSMFFACAYFLVKVVTIGGYFWVPLTSQIFISISFVLLILLAISHISGLLSNKIYARFVMISLSIRSWRTFQDLKYLMRRLLLLCPDVVVPLANPSFLKFLLNPEYYLYRVIIAIMDSKTLLDDLLSEGALFGGPALWEGDMLREVVRVKRALQSINTSGNFWELVSEYKRASKSLVQSQDQNPVWEISGNGIS